MVYILKPLLLILSPLIEKNAAASDAAAVDDVDDNVIVAIAVVFDCLCC